MVKEEAHVFVPKQYVINIHVVSDQYSDKKVRLLSDLFARRIDTLHCQSY